MIRYKNLSLSPSPKYLRVRHCGVSARDDIPNRQEEASRIPKTIPLFAGILKIRSRETYLEQFEKQFPDLSPRYQPRSRASTFAGSKPVIEGVQAAKCGKGQRGRRRSFTRWNDSTDNFVIRTLERSTGRVSVFFENRGCETNTRDWITCVSQFLVIFPSVSRLEEKTGLPSPPGGG